jgi:hypothetical protein
LPGATNRTGFFGSLVTLTVLRYNRGGEGKIMRDRLISVAAVLLAALSWWGLYRFTGQVGPDQSAAVFLFFAILFFALTSTAVPPVLFLNRRFAAGTLRRDPWRIVRQSAWCGLCLTIWTWLQMLRAFSLAFALIIAMIFIAIEVLIIRLRG